MDNRFFRYLITAFCLPLLLHGQQALAEASTEVWPVLKQSFFGKKAIERADFMKLEGPKRAESGAQVPITLTIDQALNAPDAIKKVYLFVDANPIPLTAVYHFTPLSGKAQIATRVRMEQDSFLHAVGETADGKLYMTELPIRAAGGCGGAVDGDDKAIRAAAGKIKLSIESPVKQGEANPATFLIKHPMFTGLQRDLASGGYKPAFFINKVAFSYNDKPVLNIDFGVGVAEDPYLRFFYTPDASGVLKVTAEDNEGKSFTHSVDVNI
jgi:sulfur-oxidizing protein SoxY